jgi:hypothetical protein
VAAQATTLTAPVGTAYTSTIKATSEGSITLHGPEDLTCSHSSLEAKVEQHGNSATAKGNISSLSFTGCNHSISIVTKGRLEFHALGEEGDATVTAPGLLITVQFEGAGGNIHCVYGSPTADIGTLTAALTNLGHAVLDIGTTLIPVAGGDEACGESAELTGEYTVTSPTGLQVDGAVSPTSGATPTSPLGTTYTNTIKAANEGGHLTLHNASELDIDCNWSIEGNFESHGVSVTAKAGVASLSMTGCTNGWTSTVNTKGTLEFHPISGGPDATVTWSGATFTVVNHFWGYTCRYATSGTDLGTFTSSTTTGGKPTLDVKSNLLFESGSMFCTAGEEVARLTGNLGFSIPEKLTFD